MRVNDKRNGGLGLHLLPGILRHAREARGLTQLELAIKCGVAQASVSQWESGKRPIFETTIEKLAEALDTTVGQILAEGLVAQTTTRKIVRRALQQAEG